MSDDAPAPAAPEPSSPPGPPGVTPGGYSYTVVDDAPRAPRRTPALPRLPMRTLLRPVAALALVAVAAAAIWGGLRWLDDGDGGGADERAGADVTNIIHAFGLGQEAASITRYERALPPGYPDDVPAYPGADLLSSMLQIDDQDIGYIVVWDTSDARDDVAAGLREIFDEDPWQVSGGNEDRHASLFEFSRVDDPDVQGLVIALESQERDLTTILLSLQVTGGGLDAERPEYQPPVARSLPEGFPSAVPQYPDAVLIEAAYREQPRGVLYAITMISRDRTTGVLDFYRDEFERLGWTVTDEDASDSPLLGAQALAFTESEGDITGRVVVGAFAEDGDYVQVEVQLTQTTGGDGE